jgi:asparagine synthase (glutamine-hydrolysing)
MSGIIGVFTNGSLPGAPLLQRMCEGLVSRGADHSELWRGGGAALAISRYEWECGAGFSGPVLVLEEDGCLVAADATLYYTADLRERLRARGVEARGTTPSHLILAAYRAWGTECSRWLEGEFAFILWDRCERLVFASRDFSGRRPLYYADLGETLVIGSTLGSILAHPSCPDELNLPVLAATAGILLSSAGSETCYSAIKLLPIAGDLSWRPHAGLRLGRHWSPEEVTGAVDGTAALPFERAAEELRALLSGAVLERLAPEGPTTVWMSGGWDSTAVFGIGQLVIGQPATDGETRGRSLLPVSMSYPEGDPGREDETIELISKYWGVPVHWLDSERIPLFDHPEKGAAARDEPLGHMYEHWNRALAVGSRECGSRIALDGYGGDQLFQISDIFLADLFQRGRWLELAREWRAKNHAGRRYLASFTIRPLIPSGLLDLWSTLRRSGRTWISHVERPIPGWIDQDFVRTHDLIARERAQLPPVRIGRLAETEARWYLTYPVPIHISTILAGLALREGVELRSPLYDRRVIEFALARPRWERASGRETKYLLRRAVRGLLPDTVLAPRAYRTGLISGYSDRWMRRSYPAILKDFVDTPLVLAELGIVNPTELRRAVSNYLTEGADGNQRVALFYTLQTEWWLRSRLRREAPRSDVSSAARALVSAG